MLTKTLKLTTTEDTVEDVTVREMNGKEFRQFLDTGINLDTLIVQCGVPEGLVDRLWSSEMRRAADAILELSGLRPIYLPVPEDSEDAEGN